MKKLVLVILLSCTGACIGQPSQINSFPKHKIGNVLSCLRTKLPAYPYTPPRATPHSYLVRYYYGVLTPNAEEANELQLIVYAPKEESAVLYQVYFERQAGQEGIYIGEWGTLVMQNGQMELDDTPGGIVTHVEWEQLVKVMSRQPAVSIPESDVKLGGYSCVYQQ